MGSPDGAALADASGRRYVGLDALRGIALLMVLLHHANQSIIPYLPQLDGVWGRIYWILHDLGWTGVDLFFVLSGFLIAGILLHERERYGGVRLKRFWWRRSFKILPSYVVFGVSALIISSLPWIEGAEGLGWIDLIHYALFLQNYAPASIGDPAWDYAIGPLWSLAVEEHFYLLLPLVLWMLRKQSQVRLFYLALLMCVFIFVLRCGVSWGLERYEADKLTHFRIDSLLLGVSAQILWREQGLKPLLRVCTHWLTVTLGLVGVLCWCLNFSRSDVPMFQMGFSLIAVSYACLLLAVMRVDEAGRSWGLYCSALAFIGRTSYNTYLWHCMVAVMLYPLWSRIDAILPESGALGYVLMTGIYMISSLLIGLLMTQTIESSFLHLRARFDKWHDSRLEAN